MKVQLEVLDSALIYDAETIEQLQTKELVPKMMMRRRLTRAAKIFIYLSDACNFTQGKIVFGSAYGELDITASIIKAIDTKETISPTAFQNSVYNTAASYHSILHKNHSEIITVSSFEQTSLDVLKNGALLALATDEVLLVAIETINTAGIADVNQCNSVLECGVALRVRISDEALTSKKTKMENTSIPASLKDMWYVHENFLTGTNIIEVEL
jgi:hypothetical protein